MTLEEAILKALVEVTGIEEVVICSKTRTTEVISARQIGYYLYKRVYKATTPLELIGYKLFKLKHDHSTILHNIRVAESYAETEPDFATKLVDTKTKVDELILIQSPPSEPIGKIMFRMMDLMPYNNCASF